VKPVSRLNYARIVYRLLTSPRGWRVDELKQELGIAPRTWTKYRKTLEEEFEPFFFRGDSRLKVVEEPDGRWLRLVDPEPGASAPQLVARLAAYRLAGLVLGTLGESFRQAVGDAFTALGRGRRSQAETRLLSRVNRNLDRLLYFRPHGAKDYREQAEVIESLLRALVQHRRIEIDYEASNAPPAQHELEPLTLALYQGGLYLLARYPTRERIYNFVVDRIASVQVSDQGFRYPAADEYHPQSVLSSSFGIFFRDERGENQRVELVFADKRWLQVYLLERRWHPTQEFEQLADGRLKLSFDVANLVEVTQWVRGFGDDVEVVEPRQLRG
jgi:predicted DNA-binding transcriptional regulator YafY